MKNPRKKKENKRLEILLTKKGKRLVNNQKNPF